MVGNLGPTQTLEQTTAYVNFYANLIKQSDEFLVRCARRAGHTALRMLRASRLWADAARGSLPAPRPALVPAPGTLTRVAAPTGPPQVNTLNTLDAVGLTDKTVVIKTADHGEMGTSHGTQIQKNFNM